MDTPALEQYLKTYKDGLLEDILPYAGHIDTAVIAERCPSGGRGLVLASTSGELLDLPDEFAAGDAC